MAGIHLPDIGKLGIHVATGVLDKKKVAPNNMAEEARLKAFLNRVENEKHERIRVIKKELRRMKKRKRRIDQRLEDIGRSRTVPLKMAQRKSVSCTQLPPILKSSPIAKKPRKRLTIREGDETISSDDNTEGLVSKTTIFPIQDELDNSSSNSDKSSTTLPPLSKGKDVIKKRVRNTANNSSRRISKDRKTSNESCSTIKKKTSADLSMDNEIKEESFYNNEVEDVTVEDATSVLGFDARGFLPRKLPQQSLEDAFNAIKACRYIRTPSRLENEHQGDDIKSQE